MSKRKSSECEDKHRGNSKPHKRSRKLQSDDEYDYAIEDLGESTSSASDDTNLTRLKNCKGILII